MTAAYVHTCECCKCSVYLNVLTRFSHLFYTCACIKVDVVQSVSSLHCSIGFGTIAELVATPILFVLAVAVAVSISIGIPITCGNLLRPDM